MESDAVVFALACQLLDLGDVLGGDVGSHLDHDAAVLEVDIKCVFLVRREGGCRHCNEHGDEGGHEGQTHDGSSDGDWGCQAGATILSVVRKTSGE